MKWGAFWESYCTWINVGLWWTTDVNQLLRDERYKVQVPKKDLSIDCRQKVLKQIYRELTLKKYYIKINHKIARHQFIKKKW